MNQSSSSVSQTEQPLPQPSSANPCMASCLSRGLSRHYVWLLPLLLVVLGAAAYAPAVNGVFVLDDRGHILEGNRFEQLLPLTKYIARRGLVDFTFAWNYALGGQNPRGYHIVNIVIHLLASLAFFGLMRRLLLLPQWRKTIRDHAALLAFFIAAIWMVHPLLTQAVSYVIQRYESTGGMLVLLSAYALVRQHGSVAGLKKTLWAGACVLAMVGAIWSKESMVTGVFGLLLLDWCLLSRDFKSMIRQRWWLHALLLACLTLPLLSGVSEFKTVAVAPVTQVTHQADDTTAVPAAAGREIKPERTEPLHVIPSVMTLNQYPSAGFGMPGMTWKQYFFTQPAVICFYLKDAYWPSWLSIEHNWRPMTTPWAGWRVIDLQLALGVLVTLAVLSIWLLWREPWLGLAGCWFFLSLGVTSSVIPINDLAVEHRMYLAMVSVVAMTVLGSWQLACWFGERVNERVMMIVSLVVASGVVVALGTRTFVRNVDYQSELALWTTAMHGQEPNVRTRLNLGAAMYEAGDKIEAMKQFELAMMLRPGNANALLNMGSLYYNQRDLDRAEKYYRQALRMAPASANAMVFLARVEQKRGHAVEALAYLKQAARTDPNNRDILNALAKQQFEMGQLSDAAATYEQVLAIEGPSAATLTNMGMVKVAQKQHDEALELFTRVTEAYPDFAPGWEQLARSSAATGRFKQARDALLQAIGISGDLRLQQQLAMLLAHCPDPQVRDIPQAMRIVEQGLQLTQRQDLHWLELASKVAMAANRPDLALQAEIDALAIATQRGAPPEALAQGQATIDQLREQVHAMQKQDTLRPNTTNP